jgi:tetratricopeptide (TPR) repeat protein
MSDAPWTDLIESARAGRLLVFCGSGVSSLAPSSAPSWWGFYEKIVAALERTMRTGFPEYSGQLDTKALLDRWTTQQVADLVIHGFAGPTFTELVRLLDPAQTNENHEILAALAEPGYVRGLVTTNFDTLLERAVAARGGSPKVIIPSEANARRTDSRAVPVVKLHGSAVDAQTIAEALEVKLRLGSLALGPEIEGILGGADLLVLGFGGWDLQAGIVKTFFDRVELLGGGVYWLHRSRRPAIPHPIVSKIRWVVGSLPETLRRIAAESGVDVPAPGPAAASAEPPRTRLDEAVEVWVNKLHIGRWAAMAFFLESLPVEEGSDLFDFAAAKLRAEEERLKEGAELGLDDLAMAVACFKFAAQALRRARFDDAELIGRLEIRILESFQAGATANGREQMPESRREYLMNTSSAYANLAHVYLIKGEIEQAVEMTTVAVIRAYEGRQLGSLLLALNNLVHYRDKMSRIRESLALTTALSGLAEKEGLLQVAVEAGTLACLYHAVRNEVHLALRAWERVDRLMSLSPSSSFESIHRVLRADLHLRTGDVRVALGTLAEITESSPHSVAIHLAAAELSGRLAVLGLPRRFVYDLDVDRAVIEPTLQNVEKELAEASSSGVPVFQGRLFSLYDSAGVDADDTRLLFWLGVAEFTGDANTRAAVALERCRRMSARGEFLEALWSAENFLASPGAEPLARANAHGYAAEALAQIGRQAHVDAHLDAARREEEAANVKPSPHWLELSLWHAIQSRRWDAAARMAEELGGRMAAMEGGADAGRMLLLKIATWGEDGRAVATALTRGASGAGLDFGLDPYWEESPPGEPWRRFAGALRVDASAAPQAAVLHEAERLLAEGKVEDALRKVEEVLQQTEGDLPEPLLGGMLGVQVAGFSKLVPWRKASQAMDRTRPGLLSSGRFSALAHLEGAFLLEALGEDTGDAAAPLHWPVGYLADLAADPRVAVLLGFCSAALEAKRGNLSGFAPRWAEAGAFASYYGFPMLERFVQVTRAGAEAASRTRAAAEKEDTAESLLEAVPKARDHGEVRSILRRARRAIPDTLGRLEGQVANWLLNARRYRAAVAWYARAAAKFERLGSLHELSIAYAGSARARTRMGQPEEAVRLFDAALAKVGEHPGRADLLRGRGASYFQIAMQEGRDDAEARLDDAARSFQEAIDVPGGSLSDGSYARLGLARVLGMHGRQHEALDRFDEAVAALTHLGSPLAGQLLQIRPLVAEGRWEVLGFA